MLVLRRKRHESVMIGSDIEVTVVRIDGTAAVKLGIVAPADVPVHRREIFDLLKALAERRKKKEGTNG